MADESRSTYREHNERAIRVIDSRADLLGLVEALGRLPEAMREVVVLKHCRGWTLAQIRAETGRSIPAIASLLRRGLEQLRDRLGEGD